MSGSISEILLDMAIKRNKDALSLMTLKIGDMKQFKVEPTSGIREVDHVQQFFLRQVPYYAQSTIRLGVELELTRIFNAAIQNHDPLELLL